MHNPFNTCILTLHTAIFLLPERERELCVRERLAEDKLARYLLTYHWLDCRVSNFTTKSLNLYCFFFQNRAENLMRNYNLYKQQRTLASADGPGMEVHKKPVALIDVGWYDQKDACGTQCAVPSPTVAIQTPIISAWLGRDFCFSPLQKDLMNDVCL